SFYYVPSCRAFHFVDRKGVQDTLDNMFSRRYGALKTTIVSLIGLGGAGKTQVALDRHHGLQELGQHCLLQEMDEGDGLSLLLGQQYSEEDEVLGMLLGQEYSKEDEVLGKTIIGLLGHLPLAIDQARAYISRCRLLLQDFITEFNSRKAELFKAIPKIWQYRSKPSNVEEETVLNVATTWEMSLSLLD
ncbi:hypothetical protein M422DRAFT_116958, partial [Sphaerobolus stellatus SS14]